MCIFGIHSYMHAYRIARGVTLVEFEPIEGEIPQEELEGGQAPNLPECHDHRPSTFLKGKPRSILSLQCLYKTLT
jgi:hypothetical protein